MPDTRAVMVWMGRLALPALLLGSAAAAREDGIKVDKLLLRTSSSSKAPSGTGPAESPRTP